MFSINIVLISESSQFLRTVKEYIYTTVLKELSNNALIINLIKNMSTAKSITQIENNKIYLVHFSGENSHDIQKVQQSFQNVDSYVIYIIPEKNSTIKEFDLEHIVLKQKPTPLEFKIFIKIIINKLEEIIEVNKNKEVASPLNQKVNQVVAIGASTGGTEAVKTLLESLPKITPPILVVIHMPNMFTSKYAKSLNESCKMKVKEVQNGEQLRNNTVYIAKGGNHMMLQKNNTGLYVTSRSGKKFSGHMPSVDVMFSSVAKNMGTKCIGVLLTGMGNDGAKGLLEIRQNGGHTIGQDEQTSIVYGMPKVAFDTGAVIEQVSIDKIGSQLLKKFHK